MNPENPSEERKRVKENAKLLFKFELDYLARKGSFQNRGSSRLRDSALSRIRQLCKTLEKIPRFPYEVLVECHAITHFDRCFSHLPMENLDTFIIACTVLAGKRMSKSTDFPTQLFLKENGLENKLEDIERMECQIRDILSPRMEPITATSFVDFFLALIYDYDPDQIETAKAKYFQLYGNILSMHRDAEFVQFKPSIIAAVAIVAEKTKHGPVGDFIDPILRYEFVDTDEFEKCFDLFKSRCNPPPPPTQQEE